MWSLIPLFMTSLIAQHLSPSAAFRPKALIYYPRAAMECFIEAQICSENGCLRNFKRLTKQQRQNICLDNLVDVVEFSDREHLTTFTREENRRKIIKTFETYDLDTIYIEDLPFMAENTKFQIPAHLCIKSESAIQWAISRTPHPEVVILLNQTRTQEPFQLFGLVETTPDISPQNSRTELEQKYLTGFKPEGSKKYISFCILNDMQKYRLCATAYVALKEFENKKYAKANYVSLPTDEYKCIRNAKILFNSKEGLHSINADLVPCAVNSDSNNPQFFVTNDPVSEDSAYILNSVQDMERYGSVSSYKIAGYKFMMHLNNVVVLQKLVP